MKSQTRCLLLFLTLGLGTVLASSQSSTTKVVYLSNNDIFTIGTDGKPRQLTNDGISKSYPLWSKSGTEIAFLRQISNTVALDNLLVIDSETGKSIANLYICPSRPTLICAVRYIEQIEWLTGNKIAVAGSVNPTNEQTFVFDTKTGKEIMDYLDDDGGAVFSPNGEHVAYQTGCPHFAAKGECESELGLDLQRVYPQKGTQITLLSKPSWSRDNTSVAIVDEDYLSGQRDIVVCGFRSRCESISLSAMNKSPDDRYRISWISNRVYVTFPEESLPGGPPETSWSWQHGEPQAIVSSTPPDLDINATDSKNDVQMKVQALGGDRALVLLKKVQELGGEEPDFWCDSCALSESPRRAPK